MYMIHNHQQAHFTLTVDELTAVAGHVIYQSTDMGLARNFV